MLNSGTTPYKAISETMKEFILKFKNQQTIPTDGIDLWKTILYSLEKDHNGEVHTPSPVIFPLYDEHAHAQGILPCFIRGK